jgi:hypothetical protein
VASHHIDGARRDSANGRLLRVSALTALFHRGHASVGGGRLGRSIPVPPQAAWGLTRFAEFEGRNFDGIAYLDTFFLKQSQSRNEAIHFHELIHVVQWRILGPEDFLWSYADSWERFGYRQSPLEEMAYDAELAFTTSKDAFDAEKIVAEKLRLWKRMRPARVAL